MAGVAARLYDFFLDAPAPHRYSGKGCAIFPVRNVLRPMKLRKEKFAKCRRQLGGEVGRYFLLSSQIDAEFRRRGSPERCRMVSYWCVGNAAPNSPVSSARPAPQENFKVRVQGRSRRPCNHNVVSEQSWRRRACPWVDFEQWDRGFTYLYSQRRFAA